ncbi:class I SAM-dependent rRNA methyltransferase [Rhodovibrio salinarum]|uniref:Class I SAM-dependent rRNA methyltransferase n=1 Tax=Rhodovibrio salinarum TaxID=1087 RepID=A0A934QF07_9PROT|nr:class I SAM-dependent rRNA methyltransferase [Rhodovibrio salinarum]MBK1695911.1 class I SAM-dependent rRNA methyltransferase [Rhodovibrio salinarum]
MTQSSVPSAAVDPAARPTVRLRPAGKKKRPHFGSPWIYANEVQMTPEAKALDPGTPVRLETAEGAPLGCFLFNRHPLICARLISRDPDAVLDRDFFEARIRAAVELRDKLVGVPYYRLAHAEGDGLPGTVIDRYGDTLVLQVNTAGLDRLRPSLLEALDRVVAPQTVVLRNDNPARELEGLSTQVEVVKGTVDGPVELVENGARFQADPGEGQKTGWFYDQRANRAFVAGLSKGARVLDCYAFAGGFTVQAALAGAKQVTAVDRSKDALELARKSAALNGVADVCRFEKREVFQDLAARAQAGERYDVVVVDPPAFVKSKKDYWQGIKGYRKMTRLAAPLVAPGGILAVCSCSHHVEPDTFADQIRRGLGQAGRDGRILRFAGADVDHPVHPWLPETSYLKCQVLALD